jgi:hypothetical protein
MKTRKRNSPPESRAFNLLASAVQLEAAAGEGTQQLRRFTMTAYTGGAMQLAGWRYPVVVDLNGLALGRQRRPILLDHTRDVDFVMGQTDSLAVMNNELVVAGQVMGDSAKARQVIALNDRGFSWQASIGARAEQVEFVHEGKTALANGREFAGPVNIARRSTLGEVSFVVLGADENTSAQIAAEAAEPEENSDMEFEQWLEARGFALDHIDEKQTASLRAMYDAEQSTEDETPRAADDPVQQIRAEAAQEVKRIAAIRKLCGTAHAEIEAQAIEGGWDETRVELEVLRASRPSGPAIHSGTSATSGQAIEAALCLSAGVSESALEGDYDERTLEAAQARDLRGAGLHTLVYEVIRAAGMYVRPGRVDNETIRTAFEADRQLRASGVGFSTYSLSGILSNVANKTLLQSFTTVEAVAPLICSRRGVNDFKTITSYRMTAGGSFTKVGPTGELKHITLDEDSFTNQADTYGAICGIARKDLINDDLGAFLQVPALLGRQSAIAREKVSFTLLLSNPGPFFSVGNKNLLTGGTSVLAIAGLTLLEQLFMDQTDKNGDPVLVSPAILLVPTGLKVTAQQLMTETRVNETTTAGSPKPANNPHAGKWQPRTSPYLNGQGLSGQSATAWYLFANPEDVAAMQLVYLQNRDTPIIESGEPDFDTLGIAMRGYFDFGVAMQDFRGACKSNGA